MKCADVSVSATLQAASVVSAKTSPTKWWGRQSGEVIKLEDDQSGEIITVMQRLT